MSYESNLKDGRAIFIPHWPVDVSLENLASAGKYLGAENIITISEGDLATVVVAIMEAKNPKEASNLIKHFISQVRIEGHEKLTPDSINSLFVGSLSVVTELFMHVIVAQYASFFELGLAGVNSQSVENVGSK